MCCVLFTSRECASKQCECGDEVEISVLDPLAGLRELALFAVVISASRATERDIARAVAPMY